MKLRVLIVILIEMVLIPGGLTQEILVRDDFDNTDSGWNTFSNDSGTVYYKNSELYIIDTTNSDSTTDSCYPEQFSDFILDIDTKWLSGAENNWNIIKCRYNGDSNNYGFGASADGYFCVLKYVNGEKTHFVGPVESEYIKKGLNATNHLHIECMGKNLSFSINGHLVGEFSDSSHTMGGLCLSCKAIEGEYSQISFDNLIIKKPS